MSLSESEVQAQLDTLVKRHYLRTVSGFGNRVTKYEQRFCNSEFGDLKLSAGEVALITTLLLRGAQTPGELRSRAQRMYEFSDMAEVESVLEGLTTREDGLSSPGCPGAGKTGKPLYASVSVRRYGHADHHMWKLSRRWTMTTICAPVEALEGEVAELKRASIRCYTIWETKTWGKIAHWGGRLRQHCAESVAAGAGGGGKLDAAGGLVAGERRYQFAKPGACHTLIPSMPWRPVAMRSLSIPDGFTL